MPASALQRVLKLAGIGLVLAIVGFLVLPAAVVSIAAFNDKAILSFPPQGLHGAGSSTQSRTVTFRKASATV